MKRYLAPSAREAQRLGLLGGSFDPPHRCHLEIARHAADAFELDHVLFIPAHRPPHKPGRRLATGADRVAMLELLLQGQPAERFSVCAAELAREGPSYSVDTVAQLTRTLDADLFWILGSDNLPGLPQWLRVEQLLHLVRPIVHFRRGDALDVKLLKGLSQTAIERVVRGYLELDPCDASSTSVRAAVEGGQPLDDFVSDAIRDYIVEHDLYGS